MALNVSNRDLLIDLDIDHINVQIILVIAVPIKDLNMQNMRIIILIKKNSIHVD